MANKAINDEEIKVARALGKRVAQISQKINAA
jgi:hypothetical protein